MIVIKHSIKASESSIKPWKAVEMTFSQRFYRKRNAKKKKKQIFINLIDDYRFRLLFTRFVKFCIILVFCKHSSNLEIIFKRSAKCVWSVASFGQTCLN